MAILGGLLGGGDESGSPLDIYGDLFTDKQKAALRDQQIAQGLLGMAERFGKLAMPSRAPVSFGAVLGQGLAGLGTGDETADRQIKAMQTAEAVRESRSTRALQGKISPILLSILEKKMGVAPGTFGGGMGMGLLSGAAPPAAAPAAPPGLSPAPAAAPGPPPSGEAPPGEGPPPADFATDLVTPWGAGLPQQDLSRFGLPARPRAGLPSMAGQAPDGPRPLLPIPPAPPGGRITPADYGVTMPPGQQTGLLPDPAQLASYGGSGLPGQGILASLRNGGSAPGGAPFEDGAAGVDLSRGDVVIPSGPRLQREDLTTVAAPGGAFDYGVKYLQDRLGLEPHQARGAVKWMQNVESGLDPGIVNPTSGAFGVAQHLGPRKRALQAKYGPAPSYEQQLAFIADELQGPEKKALQSLRGTQNENEAFRTWGRDFERPSPAEYAKATGQDVVLSAGGPRLQRSDLTDVASPGGGPAPAGGGVGGLGIDPEALAALNALTKMGKLGTPFDSLLETYYKSPGYLGGIKRQSEEIETEFAGPKAGAAAAATQKYIQENATHQSNLEMVRNLVGKGVYLDPKTGRMEQITNADQALAAINIATEKAKSDAQLVDTTLTFPGETQPRKVQMTGAQARAVAEGREVQIGGVTIPPMSGIKLGQPVPSEEDKAGIQARGAAQTEMYKSGQKALDTAHDAVRGANQRAPYYGSMLTAMQGFQPGATAEMRLTGMQYLKDLGVIKGDNVSQGEALRLAGERLAFLLVPPNQGSWSNIERQLLKSSIAGMAMTPEGLTDAIRMMQQLDDYDRKVSEIHRQVADQNKGLPNVLEAQRRVEALGPPLSAQQQAALEALRQPAATTAAAPAAGGAPAAAGTPSPTGFANQPVATAPLPPPPPIDKAAYDKLPRGAPYIDPNGVARTKQ